VEKVDTQQEVVTPPKRSFLAVTRMGLPLSLSDNIKCALVIVLAIMLQLRFHYTIFAEGAFAFLGFIGYVIFRYWLLRRRYPEVGEIKVLEDHIELPPCLNDGKPEKLFFEDIRSVTLFALTGRNELLTSMVLVRGLEKFKINWLATELDKLERELNDRGLKVVRQNWSPAIFFLVVMLVLLLVFAIGLFLSF
jgi:hypothetical protein